MRELLQYTRPQSMYDSEVHNYIAEILKVLRKDDYGQKLKDLIELDSSLTTRDRDGITKSFSGLMKIIYPHGD